MKKIMLVIGILFTLAISTLQAQERTPRIDKRQHRQQIRIREGVASGEVTRAEAKRLRTEQRHIRRTERRAKADGNVTPEERVRITRKQNRTNRDIRRQKNDSQNRQ